MDRRKFLQTIGIGGAAAMAIPWKSDLSSWFQSAQADAAVNPLPWTGITFCFDDGKANTLATIQPLFRQYQLVGTLFPVVGWIGDPWETSWDLLAQYVADGWEIGSHTMTHLSLPTLSDSDLDYQLRVSKETLESNLGTSVTSLAYPGGAGWTDLRVKRHASVFYKVARAADGSEIFNPFPYLPYRVRPFEVYLNTTTDQVIQTIEIARANGYWLVFLFHYIVPGTPSGVSNYEWGMDQLTQILQYITNHAYPVTTLSGALNFTKSDNLMRMGRTQVALQDLTPPVLPSQNYYTAGKILNYPQGTNTVNTDRIVLPRNKQNYLLSFYADLTVTYPGGVSVWVDEFAANGNKLAGQEIGRITSSLLDVPGFIYAPSPQVYSIQISLNPALGGSIAGYFDNFYFGWLN
jgi:peptidoglycan/xylan/chitin deacetylase (PgdA/CDA1 family)